MKGGEIMGFNMSIPLFKIDEEQKLVYGRATQEVLDKANEIMDYESSKPMFEKWSNDFATRTNGADTVKSPIGMFEADEIDNDLKLVDDTIRSYYGLDK